VSVTTTRRFYTWLLIRVQTKYTGQSLISSGYHHYKKTKNKLNPNTSIDQASIVINYQVEYPF